MGLFDKLFGNNNKNLSAIKDPSVEELEKAFTGYKSKTNPDFVYSYNELIVLIQKAFFVKASVKEYGKLIEKVFGNKKESEIWRNKVAIYNNGEHIRIWETIKVFIEEFKKNCSKDIDFFNTMFERHCINNLADNSDKTRLLAFSMVEQISLLEWEFGRIPREPVHLAVKLVDYWLGEISEDDLDKSFDLVLNQLKQGNINVSKLDNMVNLIVKRAEEEI